MLSQSRSLRRLVLSFVLAAISLVGVSPARAISIAVSGDWKGLQLGATTLASGAGSNFTTLESLGNELSIDVGGANGFYWRIDARLLPITNWPTGSILAIKRTGNGSRLDPVTGGESYMALTLSDTAFCQSRNDARDIPVQIRLSNVTMAATPGGFKADIVITVIEVGPI